MANYLGTLIELQVEVKSSTKSPQTISTFYEQQFKAHEQQLSKMRSEIEGVLGDPKKLVASLIKAETVTKKMKEDQNSWSSVRKGHYPKARAVKAGR